MTTVPERIERPPEAVPGGQGLPDPAGPRDVVPVVWRLATEVPRPTRARGPFIPSTIVMFPAFLALACQPGMWHWQRRAVLGIRRFVSVTWTHG